MRADVRLALPLMVLAAVKLGGVSVGPDAAGYRATDQTTYGFVDISPTGVRALAQTDDGTVVANIGFAFTFYGRSYTTVCISTNGYLLFGGCADAFVNQDLTSTPGPSLPGVPPQELPVIAPFWTDLTFLAPNAGAVYFQTLGAQPARQFVVQWHRAVPQNALQPVTVQAILEEGTNRIRFQYLSLDAGAGHPASNGGSATVGICDERGRTTGRCLQWSYNRPVLRAESAILFDPQLSAPGTLHGAGFLVQNAVEYQFELDVREHGTGAERGSFRMRVRRGGQSAEFRSTAIEVVIFSDNPSSLPGKSPKVAMDTVVFSGVGEWNGHPGYRFDVLAVDAGEPSASDAIRVRIVDATGGEVVHVEGVLAGGNLQATRAH